MSRPSLVTTLQRVALAAALLAAGCAESGGSSGSVAAGSTASPAQVASGTGPWVPAGVNVPSGPLTDLPSWYLGAGGDPVHVPVQIESDRFTDRAPSQVPPVLKVVTWNVEWGRHSTLVAQQLATDPELADADVLLLTEVPRHDPESSPPGINMARELAQTLRMDYVQAPEWDRRFEVKNGGEHCTAILSKYPLGNVTHIRHTPAYDHYGKLDRIGGRHTLAADALIGGERVRLYAVHFATRDLGPGRAVQAAEVLADAAVPARPARQIIGGDFNTWACNPMRLDCTQPPSAEPAVRDVLAAGWSDGTPGFTSFTQLGVGFFPQRLDYIFARGLPPIPGGRAIGTQASDHLPLFATLTAP